MDRIGAYGRVGLQQPGGSYATGGGPQLNDMFFQYDLFFGTLTAGQISTQTIQIQADSNFLWEATMFYATPAGAAEPVPAQIQWPFTLQLSDTGSGRQFFASSTPNGAIPVSSLAGTGMFPLVLPQSYVWKAVSTIQGILASTSTNTWNNCHFTLLGQKLYGSLPLNGPAIY